MFFTLMIFEILNEASVRMPKYVGMVVSIVGGLVLGETAVKVFLHPFQVIAATEEQKPSTLAAVGHETNSALRVYAQYRVISCIVPDPIAISTSAHNGNFSIKSDTPCSFA